MNKSFKRFIQLFFILLDILGLNLVYLAAQGIFEEDPQAQYYMRYAQYWLIMNGSWLLLAWLGRIYVTDTISFFQNFLRASFRVYGIWAGLNILYLLLPRLVPLSYPLVFTTVSGFLLLLLINRLIYLFMRKWVKNKVYLKRKILIIGYNNLARKLTSYLERQGFGSTIVGYIDEDPPTASADSYPLYSKLENTLLLSKELQVNEIYSTIMPENNPKVYQLMKQADYDLVRFRLIPDFSYFINRPVHVDYLQDMPILTVRREPLEEEVNMFKKRAFDLVVSSLVIVFILSWLYPLLGLLIKLESKGPVIFSQLRSGKNNKPFKCYKFRSMGENKATEAVQATKNDKRVTRIGRILRKTSLDEFPQFVNVFKGEMSIVGPRPHMLKHTQDFSVLADDYMIRQFLKPGITGWAQVNGFRGEITELYHIKKRVEHDLWYLENWSLTLDIRIMFLTVYNALKGEENAY
ncbi:undecaprenyl-phosphate glucose phosphotransferase [Cesiribacter andamanensis]|uniref:Putative colanic biosynthesis UDP-glucose lipid carrier transferase n=1 Tax=Cesiribacter andamanensis AMV16 TaxID=1279009 RepID=M7N1L6_9BACT|nr:undecaprenyl-phosphate glucose phosphotransferase [Cesiribacter andamanensis]EMR02578.1 Putative colanic biosynthesis UDP-glucose lipid carrier transferase [Cesiribacter andamanensis AMV16]